MKPYLGVLFLCSVFIGDGCRPSPAEFGGGAKVPSFADGVVESYQADFSSRSQVHMGRADDQNPMLDGSFDCTFSGSMKIVKDRSQTQWLVSLNPEKLRLTNGGVGQQAMEAKISVELRTPFLVECEPSGRVISCQFSNTLAMTKKLERTIVSLMQIVRTGEPNRDWTSQEDDTLGTREVRYVTDNGGRLSKSPIRYVANTDDKNRISTKGQESFVLRDGRIESIEGKESSQTSGQIGASWSKSDMTYRIHRLKDQKPASDADGQAARLHAEKAVLLWHRQTTAEVDHDFAVQTFGSETVDSLCTKLEGLNQHSATSSFSTDDEMRLEALMTLHPETLPRLATILSSADISSSRYSALTQAMVGVGSAPAQAALMEFISVNLKSPEIQLHLIPSLASVVAPTSESVAAIEKIVEQSSFPSAAKTATFVLGGFAGRLKTKDPTLCQAMTDYLAEKMKRSNSTSDRIVALGGLGNIGSEKATVEIEPATDDTDAKVRGQAMIALRLCPGDRPETILLAHLAKDAEPEVRTKAIFSLSFRPTSDPVLAALLVSAKTDESTRVRTAAIEALSQVGEKNPAISTVLEEISRSDPSEEIRKRAHDLVHGLSKTP